MGMGMESMKMEANGNKNDMEIKRRDEKGMI